MFYCPASKNDVCFKFCLTTEEMFADQRHSKSEEENMKLLRRPDQSRGWNHMLENLVSSHMASTPMTGINIYWYGKTAATTNLMDLSAVRRQEGSLDWPQIRYGFRVWIWECFFAQNHDMKMSLNDTYCHRWQQQWSGLLREHSNYLIGPKHSYELISLCWPTSGMWTVDHIWTKVLWFWLNSDTGQRCWLCPNLMAWRWFE